VNIAVSKSERQKHANELQHLPEKTTGSANGSAVVQPNDDSSKPLETIKADGISSPKRQPVGDDGQSSVNDRRDSNANRQEGSNGQKASTKTSAPTNNAQSASKGKGKKLNAKKASTRPTATNSSSSSNNNRQAEAAPAFNSQASTIKGNHIDERKGTNNDPSNSKAGGRHSNITKQDVKNSSTNKAAGNNKADHKPAAVETAGISLHTCAWRPPILLLVMLIFQVLSDLP